MSIGWVKRKREHWPDGSKQRALKGKSVLQALAELTKEKESQSISPKGSLLDQLSDEDLALALSGRLIKEMARLGERRARRKTDRESDSQLPGPE